MPCVVRRLSHFLSCAEGSSCETEAFPERTLVMSKKITTTTPPTEYNMEQGWNRNTHLSVDLKTLLRSDSKMKAGKNYQGILRRDEICEEFRYDEHFTFVETVPQTAGKRNPHVFDGQYITVTRRDDGSLRLNFKELPKGANFNLERFALGVYNELCMALGGLIEEGE